MTEIIFRLLEITQEWAINPLILKFYALILHHWNFSDNYEKHSTRLYRHSYVYRNNQSY